MTSIAKIIHNRDKGSGDWVIIYCDDYFYEGHSLPNSIEEFITCCEVLRSADEIRVISLTDGEMLRYSNTYEDTF